MVTDASDPTPADSADGDDSDPDPAAVRDAIRARGEAVKRTELRRALTRLESHGELSPEQRVVVRQMAAAIVDGVLANPASALADARRDDGDIVRTVRDLFDPDR